MTYTFLKFNKNKTGWEECTVDDPARQMTIHNLLLEKLINIDKIRAKKWDCIFIIDGPRRAGKSTLGMTCTHFLQPNMTINNIAAGMQDAVDKIQKLPDSSVLMIDEGSLVFNNKESMKREQVQLMKIVDVVGQKKMVLIVILPHIGDLAKPIAVTHSRFLLHVYTDSALNRGKFAYYGTHKKRELYKFMKNNFGSYLGVDEDWTGNFVDYNPLGEEYLELKRRSLVEALTTKPKLTTRQIRYIKQRDSIIEFLYKNKNIPVKEIAEAINRSGETLEESYIYEILNKPKEIIV